MTTYETNPHKRCIYCNGRDVITLDDNGLPIENSLIPCVTNDSFMCRNREECRQNVDAESTIISFGVDAEGVKEVIVTKHGKPVSQIISANGEPIKEWWQ